MDIVDVVEAFRKEGRLFKRLESIAPKELGIRNRLTILKAVDLDGYYWAIFVLTNKSPFLLKDAKRYEEIFTLLVRYSDHNYRYRVLYLKARLCSKASKYLKQQGWRVRSYALV